MVKPSSRCKPIKIDDAVIFPETAQVYIMLVVDVYQTATDNDGWRFDNVRISIY